MNPIVAGTLAGRIATGLTLAGITALLRFALQPWLGDHASFLPFTVAILLASIWAGPASGIAAAVLALLAGTRFANMHSFDPSDVVEVATLGHDQAEVDVA